MAAKRDSLEIVDVRYRPERATLLERFYRELYLPAFPVVSQRENPAIWDEMLRQTIWKSPVPRLHCVLAGHDLKDPDRAEILGGHLFEFYEICSCGLLTYLVVAPHFRRRGLGRLLLHRSFAVLERDASSVGKALQAVFGEANDPTRLLPTMDSMSPGRRLRILASLGAYVLDVPYVQPELVPGRARSRDMLLLFFSHTAQPRDQLPTELVRAFLHEFYRALGVDHPDADADFRNMSAHLDGCGEYVRLARLEGE